MLYNLFYNQYFKKVFAGDFYFRAWETNRVQKYYSFVNNGNNEQSTGIYIFIPDTETGSIHNP